MTQHIPRLLVLRIPHTPFEPIEAAVSCFVDPSQIETFADPENAVAAADNPSTLALLGHGDLRTATSLSDQFNLVFVVSPAWRYFQRSYHYHRDEAGSPAHWFATLHGEAEYADYVRSLHQDNFQTRWLVGESGMNANEIDLASLSQVVSTLSAIDALVIPENQLMEGLVLLAEKMNWPIPVLPPTIFPDNSAIADSSVALKIEVRKTNQLDDALFAMAEVRFEDRLAQTKLDVEEKVKDMKRLMLAKEVRAEMTKAAAC
jgi:hypothetical protein